MFGTKKHERSAQHNPSGTFHVLLTDRHPDADDWDLAGEMSRDDALALFSQRVARVGYPPDGPVQLRVVDHDRAVALLGQAVRA
jgi:hypothetical protein